MTKAVNTFAVLLFIVVIVCAHHYSDVEQLKYLVFVALFLSFILSICAAFNWYQMIRQIRVDGPESALEVCKVMATYNRWLQPFTLGTAKFSPMVWRQLTLNSLIDKLFFKSLFFGFSVLAVGGLISIALHQDGGRGVFGVLLEFDSGRAIAILFGVYLFISSFSVFLVGFIGKFFEWRSL